MRVAAYSLAGKGSFGGGGRVGEDECFKCGRVGHWARDCPSASGGRGGPVGGFSSRAAYGGSDGRVDRYADRDRYVDRERYIDDRYDGAPRFGIRARFRSWDLWVMGADVYVGGRIGSDSHLGEIYKKGVRVTELVPLVAEILVKEFGAVPRDIGFMGCLTRGENGKPIGMKFFIKMEKLF